VRRCARLAPLLASVSARLLRTLKARRALASAARSSTR
jgi:hypothetical protein